MKISGDLLYLKNKGDNQEAWMTMNGGLVMLELKDFFGSTIARKGPTSTKGMGPSVTLSMEGTESGLVLVGRRSSLGPEMPSDVGSGGGVSFGATEAEGSVGLAAEIIEAVKPSVASPIKVARRSSKAITVLFGLWYVSFDQNLEPKYGNGVNGLGYWRLAYNFGPLTRDFGFGYCQHKFEVDHRNRTGCIWMGHFDFDVTVGKQEKLGLQKGFLDDYDHKTFAKSLLDGNSSHLVKSFMTLIKETGRGNKVVLLLQSVEAVKDFFFLELSILDITIGMQCLVTLHGNWGNSQVIVRGNRQLGMTLIPLKAMMRAFEHEGQGLWLEIDSMSMDDIKGFGATSVAIHDVLQHYESVLHMPLSLPPSQGRGHTFMLNDGVSLINEWLISTQCSNSPASEVTEVPFITILYKPNFLADNYSFLVCRKMATTPEVLYCFCPVPLTQPLEIVVTMKVDEEPHSSELTSLLKGLVGSNLVGRLLRVEGTQQLISRLGQKWGRLNIKDDVEHPGEMVHRGVTATQWILASNARLPMKQRNHYKESDERMEQNMEKVVTDDLLISGVSSCFQPWALPKDAGFKYFLGLLLWSFCQVLNFHLDYKVDFWAGSIDKPPVLL